MNRSNKLQALFNLQPEESRLVGLLLLQYFCLGIAFNFTQTTAFTLFLTEFSAQTLAWVYLANAVIVSLLSAGYLRLSQRLTFRALLALNLGSLAALTLVFWLGLSVVPGAALVFTLPILFQLLINLGNLSFWPLAGRLFTVRQSKRLFGIVGSGQWLAIVITGFLIPTIVGWIGTVNLLLLAVVGLVGALITMLVITREANRAAATVNAAPEPVSNAPDEPQQDFKAWLTGLLRNRYIALMFALVTVWWLAFFLLDNLFYDRAAAQFPNPDQLASFLGIYLGGLGIITLLINFFVAGPVISRRGLRVSLLILPIGLAISVAFIAALGTLGSALTLIFWITVIAKLLDMSVGLSIDLSARTILYQPLPAAVRPQVQTVADGIVQPFAIGLTGILLILLNALFTSGTLALAYALLIVVIAWSFVAYRLGREYSPMLVRALARRRLSGVELSIGDASSLAILKEQLRSPHPAAIIYALNLLEEIEPDALAQALPSLLQHPAVEVRCEILERIARLKRTDALSTIQIHLVAEQSPEVRGTAIEACAALGGVDALGPELLDYLADPTPAVKRGIVIGLLQYGRAEGAVVASSQLFELIDSPRSADRVLAVQILSKVGFFSFYQPLLKLLSDSDVTVKRAALRAAGQLKYPSLWPLVIDMLRVPSLRSAATAALVAGGPRVVVELETAFARPDFDRVALARVAQICGHISGEAMLNLLKCQIDQPDARVRTEVLRALSRCCYQASPPEADGVVQRARAEAAYAARLLAVSIDCGDDPAVALLQAALADRVWLSGERVLYLLSFLYDPAVVLRARDNLRQGTPEKRAYALEVIDTLLPQSLKPAVLPLLDELTPAQRLHRLSGLFPETPRPRHERLRALIVDDLDAHDPWLQACALFSVGRLAPAGDGSAIGREETAELIGQALTTTNPLVHQTAASAQQRLIGHPGVNIMLSTLERVIILKTVSIFAETPDEILAEIAAVAEEFEAPAGQTIFEKGERGDCLYIIVSGKVRVHDHERFFNYLNERDVFGEMAVLDPEVRSASVTTEEDTRLLRVDEQALFEVMDEQPEVARGIIHVLSRHLRNRMQDMINLRDRLQEPASV
jgi:ATP/ADP translocase/HEAT repeat protein